MIVVIGATGTIGAAVAAGLVRAGEQVRALVRDPRRAHLDPAVQVAVGDLENPATLERALEGADRVFHLQARPALDQTQNLVTAARRVQVRQVVALTSMGAVLAPPTLMGQFFRAQEDLLRSSGLAVTFLRPSALMSNALWWRDSIRSCGSVADPCGEGRFACVDSEDVAAVAVRTLTEPGHEGHGYLLSGPAALTAREQVEILADVLDRPITFEDVTPHEHAVAVVADGTVPPQLAPVVEDLYAMFRSGRAGVLTEDVSNVTGRAPGGFRAWCERHAGDFA